MKKERDIRLYLDDILEAIEKIEKYTDGLDFTDTFNPRASAVNI